MSERQVWAPPCAPGYDGPMSVLKRCAFCQNRPREESAVLRWVGPADRAGAEEEERVTLPLCTRHLDRLRRAGGSGWEHRGRRHKLGWW